MMNDKQEKRHLYICDQTFQFFNILNLQYKYKAEMKADILFSDKNSFTDVIENVKRTGLFEKVYTVNAKDFEGAFYSLSEKEQLERVCNPREYLEFPEFEDVYTDIWINIDNIHVKMEYYNLIKLGMKPKVHLVQEGIANYTRVDSVPANEKKWKDTYGELYFYNNIEDNYIYRLNAFSGKGIDNVALPIIDACDNEFIKIVESIYGKHELPKEKYIFMETSLFDMNIMSNELEIFETIAKFVGKENIIVKRHPRNRVDRFSSLGYKVMEESSVPWEVIILENHDSIKQKFVCSVFSQTIFSPFDVFNIDVKCIMLLNLLRHHVFWYEKKEWKDYVTKTISEVNAENIGIYLPENEDELIDVLRYVTVVGGNDNGC